MENNKRFEEWNCKVDCNDCERWWLNQCDGVFKDAEKPCSSYLATRTVVIPEQIKSLEKDTNKLAIACILMLILDILTVVMFLG